MKVQRLPNPLRDMTREQKIALGVGVGAILVFGTVVKIGRAHV